MINEDLIPEKYRREFLGLVAEQAEQNTMTSPQAVTERYVSNLIHYGQNKDFRIVKIVGEPTFVQSTNVGYHFEVAVTNFHDTHTGIGATISQAIRQALENHGVTFR